jgi:hypothetical protein
MTLRRAAILASLFGLIAAVVAGSAAPSAPPGEVVTYRVVFTGSGKATSAYPPAAANTTVFTTTIQWHLVYLLSVTPRAGGGVGTDPAAGSSLTGVSNGVFVPGGVEIEPGCEQIALSLDRTQGGATARTLSATSFDLQLDTPGFADGELLAYRPTQCASPFPTGSGGPGCPNHVDYVATTLTIPYARAATTASVSGRCDIADQGQSASWTGKVVVTRTSLPPGTAFAGRTSQTCSNWDGLCFHGQKIPVTFEVRGRSIVGLRTQTESRCSDGKQAQDAVTPPTGTMSAGGRFTLRRTAVGGGYRTTVTGRVVGTHASGTLSLTARFNPKTGRLDAHGTSICRTTNVTWRASATP